MKKNVKVLMAALVAGTMACAVTAAVKKYRDKRKKYLCDESEEEDCFGNEDYSFTSEEEAELDGLNDYNPSASDDGDCYFLKSDVAFIRYMLEGIRNVSTVMKARTEDVERIIRRRNISNAEKVSEIQHLCNQYEDNLDLINRCAEDVDCIFDGKTPDDYFDFIVKHDKEEERDGNK